MKKLLALVLSLTLVFAMAGCGKEQTATYSITQEQEGVQNFTDTQTIKAKGDIVYEMTEKTSVDMSMADEATVAMLMEYYDEYFGGMESNAPEGVTITINKGDASYEVELVMDLKTAKLSELIDGGYLVADKSNVTAISFSQTCEALEASGYTLQE